jgi:F-type H+-transporting ATPase subunit b
MQLSAFLGVLLSGGSIIDLDGTVFVQLGMFFIAFLVLHTLVFKPMVAVLEAREKAIDGAKDEAKHLEQEVKDKQAMFESELRKVRGSAGEERERLRAEGLALESKLLDSVRGETATLVREAGERLQVEAKRVRGELSHSQADLAREIASKVIGREVQG